MPLENPIPSISERVTQLNDRYRNEDTTKVLRDTIADPLIGPIALVSSFGAEAVVLLHMISEIDPATPIIFIDTEMLFPQTLTYQRELAEDLGLRDVRRITPSRVAVFQRDPDNLMHLADRDSCCALRKSEPLEGALSGFDAWISGGNGFRAVCALNWSCSKTRMTSVSKLIHWPIGAAKTWLIISPPITCRATRWLQKAIRQLVVPHAPHQSVWAKTIVQDVGEEKRKWNVVSTLQTT